ncbi:signal transduction histidine kinase [Candidatus Scalindua japonica]|uniref:histidine kinase n=1 Tax=Candidatus Scalindua japonica TaxID=1284222 RepID=A0A286U015_9BACT|nr:ATP-binding protein [Candidatus Scalindua japonica]GAX61480.1 signal transduction histidine kinase [Candidatus Scalindua japonica]
MISIIENKESLQEIALRFLNDGVFVFDKDRRIILFNPACEQIVGFSSEEIRKNKSNCFDIFHCHSSNGECLAICPGLDLFEEKRTKIAREYLIKTKEGKEKRVITNYSIIKDEDNRVEYVVGVMRDITEEKIFNEELVRSKTLSTLGQYSNELAHEIKNPLNAINIQMSLLEREICKHDWDSGKELSEVVKIVKEEISRLNKLARDCLSFSKSGDLQRTEEDIGRIFEELLSLITPHADLSGVNIYFTMLRGCPQTLVDRDKIKQALLNIILNAVEAMTGGGDIFINVAKGAGCLNISIKDSGPGIPDEQHGKIFDLFYSTKSGGTGVGLAITKNIIHAHGGNIRFEKLDKGVAFIIELPLA